MFAQAATSMHSIQDDGFASNTVFGGYRELAATCVEGQSAC